MKREEVPIESIRDALLKQNLGGCLLEGNSISELYATVESSESSFNLSPNKDWVSVSYVQTESAHGSGGMPEWVAHEADQVLDALVSTNVVVGKAIWFDKLGMKQCKDWPAIATLNCLAMPVVCVPPTRTIEYSRYQIPDKWDTETYDFFTRVEDLLRSCSLCGSKCPLEYDSRLLNVAAALRAWPMIEAAMGSSSCGAFISFATLDRIQYTIAWYQVLLHIAIDLANYGTKVHARSIELYGNPLFHPCPRCLSIIREQNAQEEEQINCQHLDDTLTALLQQANRFCLPWAQSHEGRVLWSLNGLQRSPGETYARGYTNHRRLTRVARRTVLSQSRFEEIAANAIRGRLAIASCYREGDKLLCGLILSNLEKALLPFRLERKDFTENFKLQFMRLLKLGKPFGELSHADSWLDAGGDRSIRSPVCNGQRGHLCFLNELSGVLGPHSIAEFLGDRGLSPFERVEILTCAEQSLRRRIHAHGRAFTCFEMQQEAKRFCVMGYCAGCVQQSKDSGTDRKKHVLVGWPVKKRFLPSKTPSSRNIPDEEVYSFVTVDVDGQGHVQTRGTFSQSTALTCRTCRSKHVQVEIEDSDDLLEIHLSKELPIARALTLMYEALKKSHRV